MIKTKGAILLILAFLLLFGGVSIKDTTACIPGPGVDCSKWEEQYSDKQKNIDQASMSIPCIPGPSIDCPKETLVEKIVKSRWHGPGFFIGSLFLYLLNLIGVENIHMLDRSTGHIIFSIVMSFAIYLTILTGLFILIRSLFKRRNKDISYGEET